jgi:hypothetical protein
LAATGIGPLVGFGAWQLVQRSRFGSLPLTSSGDNNLTAPLAGLIDQLAKLAPPSGGEELFRLASIGGLVALLSAAGWTLWNHRSDDRAVRPWELTGWVLSLGVVLVLNAYLWSGATAFMRAATEVGLLSTLAILGGRGRRSDVLLRCAGAGLGGLWLLTAVAQLSKLG